MEKKEIWKDIEGYENYQISNMGNVKRKKSKDSSGHLREEKKLKIFKDIYGYNYCVVCKNGKRKNILLHRMIMKTFSDDYDDFKQINHIDGNKTNNSINNLEMVTDKENKKHGWNNGLYSIHKCKPHKIIQYDLLGNKIKVWKNMKEITDNTDYNKQRIYNCIKGIQNKTSGYIWRFYEEDN